MRESIIIYRSFYDAIKELEPKDQAEVWRAVFEYGLNKNEVDLSGLPSIIFKLIKPQLDANIRKYENGTKGGRPKKQTETKLKPNNNLNETKAKPNVNDNENVNDNYNDNTNDNNEFLDIWSLYGKVGNKTTAMAKYNRLTKKEKESVNEHIPRHIRTISRYLNIIERSVYRYIECFREIGYEVVRDKNWRYGLKKVLID